MDFAKASSELTEQRRSVGFDSYDITIKQLVSMVGHDEINIAPEYQRHFVWDDVRQSQLIESLYLGIPVPSLFMATNEDATWEVVDGLQRLTTLLRFVEGVDEESLKLRGLEKLSSLNGAVFSDLPQSLQLSLLTRPIRITVLNDRSDHQVRFDLFERLNTGGIVLHEQEIRSCVFLGRFNDFVKSCASDERVVKLVKRTDIRGRGNLEELILKFFAYFERSERFKHSVKDFLNEYMEEKTISFKNEIELKRVFDRTFDFLCENLPNGIVRSDRPNTTPLLVFEAATVGVACAIRDGALLDATKLIETLDGESLKKATSGGTNSQPKLRDRIDIVKKAVSN